MLKVLFILLCSLIFSQSVFAQNALDNYRLLPIKEPAVLRMKAMKVKMKRTLEVKDTKPTVCDYWDTTYYTYSGKTIKSLYIAFNPIRLDDQYTVRSCTDDPGPKVGYPSDHKWTHEDSMYALQESQEPKPFYPGPSDSVLSTYDLDGYLLSRVNKIYSGGSTPKAEYYYFTNAKQCIGYSKYDYFGLKDSTHLFFDSSGKLIKWVKVSQHSLPFGGTVISNCHIGWDTTIVRFGYDSRGNCIEFLQTYITEKPKDSNGKKVLVSIISDSHSGQIFNSDNRIIGFIKYYNNGKPDTSQRWSYVDSGGTVYRYATAPWIKKPSVSGDSSIFDASGKKIGTVKLIFYNDDKISETYIGGRVVFRTVMSLDANRISRRYTLTLDSVGNTLKEMEEYISGGNYNPGSQVTEYRYDKNGLATDGFFTYEDSRHQPFKRHVQYLYTFAKK